ncbi:MAG: MCE family protein [Planctomycetes bacterium]|nr:MCE family protein [Planctomycetota bacterium]
MATRQEKVTAGLFLLLGIALVLAVLFLIAGIRLTQGTDTYFVVFDGSIGNLKEGSPVKFMGVPVGTVGDLHLTRDLASIEAELNLVKGTRITSGTRAMLRFNPLTNVYFIELNVNKGALGEDLPPGAVIAHERSEVDEFVSELPELKNSMQRLLEEVVDLLDQENRERFTRTLEGLGTLLEQVNTDYPRVREEVLGVVHGLGSALDGFETTMEEYRIIAGDLETDARTAMTRGADAVELGMGDFSRLLNDLDLKGELGATREALVQVLQRYEGAAREMEGLVAENRNALKALIHRLDALTRQFQTLVDQVDQDPSRLLWPKPNPERITPD